MLELYQETRRKRGEIYKILLQGNHKEDTDLIHFNSIKKSSLPITYQAPLCIL